MNTETFIKQTMACDSLEATHTVQALWSGYGEIVRYSISEDNCPNSIIVKHILPPTEILDASHPRGWSTKTSHVRKLISYQVEANWYQYWSSLCEVSCAVPTCFGILANDIPQFIQVQNTDKIDVLAGQPEIAPDIKVLNFKTASVHGSAFDANKSNTILLSDLDLHGFPIRHQALTLAQAKVCIKWLANFHGKFMQDSPSADWPQGLWDKGCYWHLETRQDEYKAMPSSEIKRLAPLLDKSLNSTRFKTLIHGDAKVANFCFNTDSTQVAAVDFQYVGGGCGMRDLVYFIGSCLTDKECEASHKALCSYYFSALHTALQRHKNNIDASEVENEWSRLFSIAWADFHRFILGWSPDHKKNNEFSRSMAVQVIASLKSSPNIY
ncbi:ecdysteroid 22-kinase family protein [Shewanella sp. UCD-KL12]|uniref:ecdysteroid 22-kinase family protein n=1 Tax=Shewanella sp. UCD-KL12 TaxID=1917163 RepID=UPI002116345C|nr:ecdysteroid 22-kinase family protein [Shewanella sp. UCD-KL12]